jgi:hypothetical protein
MRKKIIKVNEDVSHYISTEFTTDLGLFQVKARVYSMKELCSKGRHDVTDIELDFLVNNKPCAYRGFKELYEKLYGENSFNEFCEELKIDFWGAYFKHSPYRTK